MKTLTYLTLVYGFFFGVISGVFWLVEIIRSRLLRLFYPHLVDKPRKLRILARDTVSHYTVAYTNLNKFIVWREALVPNEYILKPEVFLYTFTSSHAVFVELSKQNSLQLYNMKKYPFVYMAQYDLSLSFIFVSIKVFHEIAEAVGDPKYPFLFVPSAGRSGSTLIASVFNSLPRCLSISEPNSLCEILSLYYCRNAISEEQMKLLVKDTIRYMLRSRDYDIAVLKPRSECAILMSVMVEIFPNNAYPTILYVYRDALDYMRSCFKLFNKLSNSTLFKYKYKDTDDFKFQYMFPFGSDDYEEIKVLKNSKYGLQLAVKLFWIVQWGITNSFYLSFHSNYPQRARCLSYDRLVANPQNVLGDLLACCGLSKEYLPLAMNAMSLDSQEGTILSTRNSVKKKEIFSYEDIATVKEVLENIPRVSTDLCPSLPGDISDD